jgi:hypothetical protein
MRMLDCVGISTSAGYKLLPSGGLQHAGSSCRRSQSAFAFLLRCTRSVVIAVIVNAVTELETAAGCASAPRGQVHRRYQLTVRDNVSSWSPGRVLQLIVIVVSLCCMAHLLCTVWLCCCSWWPALPLASARTTDAERNALVELYTSTSGSQWWRNRGWVNHENGSDPCDDQWPGVYCDSNNTAVE